MLLHATCLFFRKEWELECQTLVWKKSVKPTLELFTYLCENRGWLNSNSSSTSTTTKQQNSLPNKNPETSCKLFGSEALQVQSVLNNEYMNCRSWKSMWSSWKSIEFSRFAKKRVPFWRILKTRWGFQIFFIFTPIWGRFPIWLIFFNWVETTN